MIIGFILFIIIQLQMDSNFKVSIGMDDNAAANEGDYTRVNFDFEIQTQRINAITQELSAKTGKYRVPTLVFDFPQSAKELNLSMFQSVQGEIQYEVIQKDGRIYKCLDLINPDFVTTRKKIQKVFSKLTDLDNKLYLHMDFHNVDGFQKKLKQKQDHALVVILEKSRIQGRFGLDPKFFDVLTECIARVSPKFAESPIMAVLPLFGGADCELELDSLNFLENDHQQEIFAGISYEDPGDDAEGVKTKGEFKNKEKVYIYFSFGCMAVLKVELEVRMFALYNCMA